MDHNEMIAIIQAHSSGKQLQFKERGERGISELPWVDLHMACFGANFERYEYRIKPEPREWFFIKNINQGLTRDGWTRHNVRQEGVDYLEQVHVREVLP